MFEWIEKITKCSHPLSVERQDNTDGTSDNTAEPKQTLTWRRPNMGLCRWHVYLQQWHDHWVIFKVNQLCATDYILRSCPLSNSRTAYSAACGRSYHRIWRLSPPFATWGRVMPRWLGACWTWQVIPNTNLITQNHDSLLDILFSLFCCFSVNRLYGIDDRVTSDYDEQTKTNIHALSGIRTLGLSIQAIKAYSSHHAATETG
jgi:hypothetical protein